MLLTSDGLGLFVLAALLTSFVGLCFCLFVVWRNRDNRRQTFEAIGLLGISVVSVYTSLMLHAYEPGEAAPWKFCLLAALALYIVFNIATFPQQSK